MVYKDNPKFGFNVSDQSAVKSEQSYQKSGQILVIKKKDGIICYKDSSFIKEFDYEPLTTRIIAITTWSEGDGIK